MHCVISLKGSQITTIQKKDIMKIGILTQPLKYNYGGILQNYALQQVLIGAGHSVETLDWDMPKSLHYSLYRLKWKVLSMVFPNRYPKLKYQPTAAENAVMWRNTNRFISSYINRTRVIRSHKGFEKQAKLGKYDAYVVGSDQCWRPCYNAFLSSMYLDFAKDLNVMRIAYAASFGTDNWEYSQEQEEICASLAKKFELVTVREDSGVSICKQHLGVNAVHVLDPTMLLTKDDYIKLIESENEPPAAGTLFNYILDPDKDKSSFIKRVADAKGLTVFQVLPKFQAENRTKKDVKKHIEDCVFPAVTAWLQAFNAAEMTVVDSFHGMVFSIIFNKPFWVIGNERRGMSRFTSLLRVLHLEDRLLDSARLDEVDLEKPIDWEEVNGKVDKLRSECKSILFNKLSE